MLHQALAREQLYSSDSCDSRVAGPLRHRKEGCQRHAKRAFECCVAVTPRQVENDMGVMLVKPGWEGPPAPCGKAPGR